MNISQWPFTDGAFVYMNRPGKPEGWYFIERVGPHTHFLSSERNLCIEALILELQMVFSFKEAGTGSDG